MEAVLDPASSARWFDGWKAGSRTVQSAPESAAGRATTTGGPRADLAPHLGWRRHGLLDPADVPG